MRHAGLAQGADSLPELQYVIVVMQSIRGFLSIKLSPRLTVESGLLSGTEAMQMTHRRPLSGWKACW